MSTACASLSQFFSPLIEQGLTGAGTHIIQVYKDVNDSAYADEPFVKTYRQVVKDQGLSGRPEEAWQLRPRRHPS